MRTKFLQSDLWKNITHLAKKARRRYAAVAYIGSGANRLLPLGKGDVLIADFSRGAIRSGQTDPREILRYIGKGVEVHSCSNLHAKVFVFDNRAIVGSTNVSRNSRDQLIESALMSNDPDVVRSARGFILSLRAEPVTRNYARECLKEYKRDFRPSRTGTKRVGRTPAHPRLWVHRVYGTDFTEREEEIARRGKREAKKQIRSAGLYRIEEVKYYQPTAFMKKCSKGDLAIHICEEGKRLYVYPPARILHIKGYRLSRQDTVARKMVFFEYPKDPRRITWERFVEILKKAGMKRISEHIDREITNPELKHRLLGLWPAASWGRS